MVDLIIVNPYAAWIDIKDTEMEERVPANRDGENNRLLSRLTCEMKDSMVCYLRRLKSRGRHMSVKVATAQKMAGIFYILVKNKVAYQERKVGSREEKLLRRKIARKRYWIP